jgi:mannose-6-phosphate isomerase-like protein (cupin superfamily)
LKFTARRASEILREQGQTRHVSRKSETETGVVPGSLGAEVVAGFNGHDVMAVKVEGEFVWHAHANSDDFFLVLKGRLAIQLTDRNVELGPGELYIVRKGVEHRLVAREKTHLLLIEPHGEPNIGDAATATPKQAI